MTKSYPAMVRSHVRLSVLQILASDLGHSMNHEIMRDALEMATAHSLTEDEVKAHFAWLEDRRLITTEELERYRMAVLSDRGLKLVQGKERVEGVRLPSVDEREKYL